MQPEWRASSGEQAPSFRQRNPRRATKRLIAQLEALGYTVTLQEAAAT
jgi:hypothetical protein